MNGEPDLVSLLYRTDWTRLGLAAEVHPAGDRDLPGSRFEPGAARAGQEWEMATDLPSDEEGRSTLLIAPGRRYREQSESYLSGCDGDRSWLAVKDDDGWTVETTGGPSPPLAHMLRPSWLLTGFTLEPGKTASVSGRDGLRVVATSRPGIRDRTAPGPRSPDRVEVIVDAELGILLRCEEILDGRPQRVTELTDVRVDPAPVGDDARFLPPGGWDFVDDDVPRSTPAGPGREVTKLAAGLTAGGLGALIRSARFRPFEQATQEEPEAEMPVDEEPSPADGSPAEGSPVGDEVLHLLHGSPDRWAPGIVATLHQWHDVAAMLAQIPDGARRTGFGGLGFLIDAASGRIATLHMVSRLRLGDPGRYRIEPVTNPGRRRAETIICDGQRRWRIGEDEIVVGPATPPPSEIANLFDSSWLLEHRLTGGTETETGGRRGYRLGVASEDPIWGGMFIADEVVVDAELGILLRSISHGGSRPVSRYELRDVVLAGPGELADFQADIPPGMRVVDEPEEDPLGPVNIPVKVASLLARQAAKDARSAVRSVLGVIRGEGRL